MKIPLLPLPWPLPTAGVGADHSTCSWQSPNSALVEIAALPQMSVPSLTSHESAFFHCDLSLPSNNTMASEGGSAFCAPGVTTAGAVHLIPLRYSWPEATDAPANKHKVERSRMDIRLEKVAEEKQTCMFWFSLCQERIKISPDQGKQCLLVLGGFCIVTKMWCNGKTSVRLNYHDTTFPSFI